MHVARFSLDHDVAGLRPDCQSRRIVRSTVGTGAPACARALRYGSVLVILARVARRPPIDVFGYLDYRVFLRAYYLAKKEEGRGFSYRAFSRRAGLGSPNHLKRVTEGERNLTPQMAVRYADAIGLTGDAAAYFGDLVVFTQARSSKEKNRAYQKLTEFRGYRRAHRLDAAHAAYHANWYVPAICEMSLQSGFEPDAAWIAQRMIPPISQSEAKSALETLLELGLLRRTEQGGLEQAETVMTTGSETRGVHIVAYHRAMMERASESIDLVGPTDRDISSVTFCVGKDGLARIKQRVQQFRKEMVALATQEQDGEQVLQLNMQLFPLTERESSDEES